MYIMIHVCTYTYNVGCCVGVVKGAVNATQDPPGVFFVCYTSICSTAVQYSFILQHWRGRFGSRCGVLVFVESFCRLWSHSGRHHERDCFARAFSHCFCDNFDVFSVSGLQCHRRLQQYRALGPVFVDYGALALGVRRLPIVLWQSVLVGYVWCSGSRW